jgi:large subunit ribosomal protein L29
MKVSEYQGMEVEELGVRVEELRKSLFNLRTRAATKELENISRIRIEKRELARVLTVMAEKQQAEQG